ncbi:hypothetical protein [Larkinella soli]|uniref:hypothetical protein n=1 Tax=Larkinella soli TaxID=1770527 RepID=UPI000FFB5BEB|nr:hypothetical protein [Larkinella soli]
MNHRPEPGRYYYIHSQPSLLTESLLKTLQPPNRPQPIRLTKPWLTSFGFRPDASAHSWIRDDSRLVPGLNCWVCVATRRYIKFVHELQDWYLEVYGEELSLTESALHRLVSYAS